MSEPAPVIPVRDAVSASLARTHESLRKSLLMLKGLPDEDEEAQDNSMPGQSSQTLRENILTSQRNTKEILENLTKGVVTHQDAAPLDNLTLAKSATSMHKGESLETILQHKRTETQEQLSKRISLRGVLQPYCAYRFDTETGRRPITSLTSGCSVLYSALAVKNLWQKKWSKEKEPEQGLEPLEDYLVGDFSLNEVTSARVVRLVNEKSALVQAQVKEMVALYGEQEGEQIYLTDESLVEKLSKKWIEGKEPFQNIFMLSQEKKIEIVERTPGVDWVEAHEEVEGQTKELFSFLTRCTKKKEEACACVIGTFISPFKTYDRVLAVVCKKTGRAGPTFIYIDPLNRGMKKNPRARLFVTFLLKQAIDSRSMPEEKGLFGRLFNRLSYAT
jgi:hypothetical protein